ncbi:PREDICTED: uncharacterized protein LOC106747954 [Dinoponera quadriceps]|uniref:Uncharacterized protein LOC106747954 n=1 Tax=Dinoponera quadriceps TaxID=609295 RepID=A0A6P3XSU9_DINQU|nr:PREDICTED: uncharacterized protein LOC106747954 [Dinoponera quadriceps]
MDNENIVWSSGESEPDDSDHERDISIVPEAIEEDCHIDFDYPEIAYDKFFYPSIKDFTGSFQIRESVTIPGDAPLDYFEIFFDEPLFKMIVTQTNLYQTQNPEQARINMKPWTPVTVNELRVFLALSINMGHVRKATHCNVVHELLAIMDTDWHECANIDQHLHVMKTKARLSHFCVNVWLSLNTIGEVLYFGSNNAIAIMHLEENDNNTSRPFPMVAMSTINPLLKLGLRILGIWPDVPYATVRRLILVWSTLIVQYFQYMFMFKHFKLSELEYLTVDGFLATVYYTLTIMKMMTLWKNHRVVREILAAMDTDWRECVNVDEHLHLMKARASVSSFCTKVLFVYNVIAGGLYFGGNNLNALFDLENGNGTSRPLPVSVELPFEANQSPIYELLVVVLFLHSMMIICVVNFLSTFLLTLMVAMSTINPLLKLGLQILGVWPEVPFATVRRLIHIWSILIVQYFQYVYIFTHFKLSELQYLVDSLPATLYYTLTTMKMITLWKYHRKYLYPIKATHCSVVREILAAMDTDWRECVNVNEHLHLMRVRASLSSFCTNALLGFNTFAGGLYFGGNNLNAFFDLVETGNGTSRPFPVSVVLPFEANQSPIYELLVVILFLHSMMMVYTVNLLSSFILTLCKSLGDAAYDSLWYNMSSSHGRNILFIIMRSQKQQTITVGGITNLTLEAFTSMVLTSTISPSVKFGLRFLGALPDVPYAVVNRMIYLSIALTVLYFQYVYLFAHCKPGELQNLVDSLPAAFYYSLTTIKVITLWKERRVVRKLLAAMDTDWRECVNVDQHLHMMTTKAGISHFCSNALFGFNTFAGAIYVMADTAIAIAHQAGGDNDTSRPFPIKILLPFEAEHSPIYELLVIVLFMHAMLNVYSVTIVNTLLFTLILHASGQIDIICEDLKIISEEISSYGSSGHALGILVERHNKVISFSENVDKLFSFIALMQVLLNTIVICALGLFIMASVDESGVGVIKTAFAYGAVTIEMFIICFVGEYLSIKSISLADAAYDSLWYNMSSNHAKNMLFVIMRSQRELTITAGGMTTLSLEAFASIMKASASYVSVLYAMY